MKTILKRTALVISCSLIVLGLVSLAGCSSGYGNSSTKTTSTTAVGGNSVSIINFSFSPPTLNVSVGTTVIWTNNDSTTHTVTSDSGVFQSSNLTPGATYSFTFNSAGTFPYHCSIHPSMQGSVIVK